jgi:DNA-binding SARP family transcriptional activator/cell division protein FtsB/energy-coupling factor transporter ATP-binding protein EcfA2
VAPRCNRRSGAVRVTVNLPVSDAVTELQPAGGVIQAMSDRATQPGVATDLGPGRDPGRGPEPGEPGSVTIGVLGPLSLTFDAAPVHVAGTHRRRLLALLASRPGRVVSIEAIVDALWGSAPPATASKTIQSHVARLRRSLDAVPFELIETAPGGYRLAAPHDAVDAVRFELGAAAGRSALAAGDARGAALRLAHALSLWRGDAYGEFADADFAVGEATRLDEIRWSVEEDLAEARMSTTNPATVIADLERVVAEQPGRERSWALLMRALYGAGRQHDALIAFQRARRALADGFGLDPGPDLRQLEQQVLEQSPDLVTFRRPAIPAGLRRDENPFVGRDRELAMLVDAWRSASGGAGQVRLVFGTAGSGRTRLAAELAAIAAVSAAAVLLVRGADGFAGAPAFASADTAGAVADVVIDTSRTGAVLLVIDDAEWASAHTIDAINALVRSIEFASVLVVVIAAVEESGASVAALRRLAPTAAATTVLERLDDDSIAEIAAADGVGTGAIDAVVAGAEGLPGVARREALAWAERAASERLSIASAASVGAATTAERAEANVFDEVLALVAARSRRDALVSETWAGRQPYRALAPYGVEDADLFVGRERMVAELAARVVDRRMVAVIGASGSGKSSLVRAGLVPLVRSGRLPGGDPWRTHVIVPGSDPIAALERLAALDEPGVQLLVVDQFEEVAVTGVAAEFAERLLDLTLDAALDVHVVVVIRSDQFPALAGTAPIGQVIDDALVVVTPPSDTELARIVEEPARRTGCLVEAELVARIRHEVAGREAALPLVSAALAEVWRLRDGDTLTAARYTELGGLAAAVERMGGEAVGVAGHGQVREVMLRLVDVTDDGQWIRRRVATDSLPARLTPAVDALVAARLVQRLDDQVDVVHEVVFRAWPLLAAWLETERADLVLDRELTVAARAWDAGGRSDDDVYRGARLEAAADFVVRRDGDDAIATEFVAAGRRLAQREHDAVQRQLEREVRARRRLSRSLVVAAVLLIVAALGGTVAVVNQQRATDQRARAVAAADLAERRRTDAEQARAAADDARSVAETATTSERAARETAEQAEQAEATARREAEDRARELGLAGLLATSQTMRSSKPDVAALLAATAHEIDPGPDSLGNLLGVFATTPTIERTIWTDATLLNRGELVSDDTIYAVTDEHQDVRLIDIASGEQVGRLDGTAASADVDDLSGGRLAASADGSKVAVATFDSSASTSVIDMWDVSERSLVWSVTDVPFAVNSIAFAPGRALLAVAGGPSGDALVMSATDGAVATSVPGLEATAPTVTVVLQTAAVAFEPDGALLVTGRGVPIREIDTSTGAELRRFDAPLDTTATVIAIDAAGGRAFASGALGTVSWDLATGEMRWAEPAPGKCQDLDVVVRLGVVLCSRLEGDVVAYGLDDGRLDERFPYQYGIARTAGVTADADRLVISGGSAVVVHRLDGGGAAVRRLDPRIDRVPQEYLADGSMLIAQLVNDPNVPNLDPDIVDAETGALLDPLPGVVAAVGAPGDGSRLAALFDDGTAGFYDVVLHERVPDISIELPFVPGNVTIAGDVIVTFSVTGRTQGIDPSGNLVAPTFPMPPFAENLLAASPDGSVLYTFETEGMVPRDLDGQPVDPGVAGGVVDAVFSSTLMVAQHADGSLHALDPVTLQPLDRSLPAATGGVGTLVAARDAPVIAISDESESVRVIDTSSGEYLGPPLRRGNADSSLTYSAYLSLRPDGEEVAFSSQWGVVVWELSPEELMAAACRLAGRSLTQAEWDQHVGALSPYTDVCA